MKKNITNNQFDKLNASQKKILNELCCKYWEENVLSCEDYDIMFMLDLLQKWCKEKDYWYGMSYNDDNLNNKHSVGIVTVDGESIYENTQKELVDCLFAIIKETVLAGV